MRRRRKKNVTFCIYRVGTIKLLLIQNCSTLTTSLMDSLVILRRVHTNPLKCALDQIASSRFEPIRIRSVHTLFTESEFDYGLPKIYCEAHNDMKVCLEIYTI